MDQLKSSGKPFEISKWEVWEAYRQVKAFQTSPSPRGICVPTVEIQAGLTW